MVAFTTAVMQAGKHGRRLKLTDFLLTWGRKRQSGEEMLAKLKQLGARREGDA